MKNLDIFTKTYLKIINESRISVKDTVNFAILAGDKKPIKDIDKKSIIEIEHDEVDDYDLDSSKNYLLSITYSTKANADDEGYYDAANVRIHSAKIYELIDNGSEFVQGKAIKNVKDQILDELEDGVTTIGELLNDAIDAAIDSQLYPPPRFD